MINDISHAIKELETLRPPDELLRVHKILIQKGRNIKKLLLAILKGDSERVSFYELKAKRNDLEGFKEMKSLWIKHGGPQEKIAEMDKEITAVSQFINGETK